MECHEEGIDLVVPWVDGSDPEWKRQREKYIENKGHESQIYYRDWGLMRYWFRGVETNIPWIRRIHFITWGHLPLWLNEIHPKLRIVRHEDFIPEKYRPVFSSHSIEALIHNIPDLSEQFIYANDDTYFVGEMRENDFFRNGLPCDCLSIEPISEYCCDGFGHIIWNNIMVINRNFDMQQCFVNNREKWLSDAYSDRTIENNREALRWNRFSGFGMNHYVKPFLKSVFSEVWNKERSILDQTCCRHFRTDKDVSNWLMRYWQLASGRFTPYEQPGRVFVRVGDSKEKIRDAVLKKENRIVCINEGGSDVDYCKRKNYIQELFQMRFPEMSSFEKY